MAGIRGTAEVKDLTISERKLYSIAIVFTLVVAYIAMSLYAGIWGAESVGFEFKIGINDLGSYFIKLLVYFTLMIILFVLHELLHGAACMVFGGAAWKEIKFGILWRSLSPYAHCSKALSPSAYRSSLLLPNIVLGIIPMVLGMALGIGYLAFWGTFMFIGGIGDFMVLFLIRKVPKGALVLDHSSKIGCEVFY